MDKAIIAFLNRPSTDPRDQLAKRAIHSMSQLFALAQIADDRGNLAYRQECLRGADTALWAFALINADMDYAFASAIHPEVAGRTQAMLDLHNRANKAAGLLVQASLLVQALTPVLTPVPVISGLASPAILRGDYCLAALAGLTLANDNLQRRP